jgi:hypothetical protein
MPRRTPQRNALDENGPSDNKVQNGKLTKTAIQWRVEAGRGEGGHLEAESSRIRHPGVRRDGAEESNFRSGGSGNSSNMA